MWLSYTYSNGITSADDEEDDDYDTGNGGFGIHVLLELLRL